MIQKPLLSICIPTYNRSEHLKACLDSIVNQHEFSVGDVEIIISDNASSDDTKSVGIDYDSKFENIHYYRNDSNIVDRNFLRAIQLGNGIYRKLANDSVVFKPNSLHEIICIIKENIVDRPFLCFTNGYLKRLKDEVYSFSTLENFVKAVSFYLTWIGCFGLWEDKFDNIAHEKGFETKLWQAFISLSIVSEIKESIVCNKVLMLSQDMAKKDISYGLHKIFYKNYLSLYSNYLNNGEISTKCFKWLERDLLYGFFTQWLILFRSKHKSYEYSDDENLVKLVFNSYRRKPYFLHYYLFYQKEYLVYFLRTFKKRISNNYSIT